MFSLALAFLRKRLSTGLGFVLLVVAFYYGIYYAYRSIHHTGYVQGYAKRVAEAQALALDAARDAAKATARLRDDKQQLDAHYVQLQANLQRAAVRSSADAVRLRRAIATSRSTAAAPGATGPECRAASERDGELLADMEQAGRAMATEADRLATKVMALQPEVLFYFQACQAEAAP